MAGIIHNELFKVLALYKSFNSFKVMPTILPHTLNNTSPSVSVFNIKWPIPTHTWKRNDRFNTTRVKHLHKSTDHFKTTKLSQIEHTPVSCGIAWRTFWSTFIFKSVVGGCTFVQGLSRLDHAWSSVCLHTWVDQIIVHSFDVNVRL